MRAFYQWLDEHKKVEALLEVVFGILITFLPFVVASLMAQSSQPAFSQDQLVSSFLSYFQGGELSLVILSSISTSAWLIYIRYPSSSNLLKIFTLISIVIIVLLVGSLLGTNPGFTSDLPGWLLYCMVATFGITWLFHLLVAVSLTSSQQRPTTSLDRARDLQREAREKYSG